MSDPRDLSQRNETPEKAPHSRALEGREAAEHASARASGSAVSVTPIPRRRLPPGRRRTATTRAARRLAARLPARSSGPCLAAPSDSSWAVPRGPSRARPRAQPRSDRPRSTSPSRSSARRKTRPSRAADRLDPRRPDRRSVAAYPSHPSTGDGPVSAVARRGVLVLDRLGPAGRGVAMLQRLLGRFLPTGAILLSALTFGSYAMGLIRDRIFARTFGAGSELDAYNAAFVCPSSPSTWSSRADSRPRSSRSSRPSDARI